MPRRNALQQDQRQQKEIPLAILTWLGMKSNYPAESIPVNSFQYLLNYDYVSANEVQTRQGTTLFTDDAILGANNSVVGGVEFHRRGDAASALIVATSNGKLYAINSTTGGAPTYLGDLTTTETLKRVSFATLKNKLYIADGVGSWVYDPDAIPKVQSLSLPFAVTAKVVDVLKARDSIWWLSDEDDIVASAPNDPSDYVTDLAWQSSIAENDGMSCVSMVRWGKAIVIVKYNSITYDSAMYMLSGYSVDTYQIDPMYGDERNPVGFVGKSALPIGNDVLGLTREGFSTLSAIQNFQDTTIQNLSVDINDYVNRINWDYSYKVTAIYDIQTHQYLCAAPIDASSVNNIVFVYDTENRRWSLYDNWPVRSFFRIRDRVCYGSEYGTVVRTRDGENDLGLGFNKIIVLPDWHFDDTDAIKYFKHIELDIAQSGEYDVNLIPVIDGYELKAVPIPLTLKGSSRWDVFQWDVDPWDSPLNTKRTVLLTLRGKTLRIRIENNQPDEPIALRSVTIRSYVTDAGAFKQ